MGQGVIFVLEDEVAVRTVLVDALSSAGHDVREFGDGQQALDAIDRALPELILLDIPTLLRYVSSVIGRDGRLGASPAKL